jgi:hypothetical protein
MNGWLVDEIVGVWSGLFAGKPRSYRFEIFRENIGTTHIL